MFSASRRDWEWDIYRRADEEDAIERMTSPVRCRHCRTVYDVGTVTVTARYTDCSLWTSPCCNRQVDDRQWKGLPDIEYLNRRSCT